MGLAPAKVRRVKSLPFYGSVEVSMGSDETPVAALVRWLRQRHDAVMNREAEALRLLDAGDTAGYRAAMREKAALLEAMSGAAASVLAHLPGELRGKLAFALERFSSSARQSLSLDSVFYMSALLYPDAHKAGEPDNLALFIDRVEREGEGFGG